MSRVVVVGARRRRQGIGEFLAHAFSKAGAEIVAVVGTTPETSIKAQTNLLNQFGIRCATYNSLTLALEKEVPDIVVICTPFESHLEHLKIVQAAGAHCLCEKPLTWETDKDNVTETSHIVDGFINNKRYLSLVTQWPYTLSSFYSLYPDLKKQPITEFEMILSPIRPGPNMVLDTSSHLMSMLYALAGNGKILKQKLGFTNKTQRQMALTFEYQHAGDVNITVNFTANVCEESPRPASYSINGHNLSRRIVLPGYGIWFDGNDKSVEAIDPLNLLVADFIKKIDDKCMIDRQAIIGDIEALELLNKTALNTLDI